jgi:hypothetical protein
MKDRQKGFYSEYPEYESKVSPQVEDMRRIISSFPINILPEPLPFVTEQTKNLKPAPLPSLPIASSIKDNTIPISSEISNRNSDSREDIRNERRTNENRDTSENDENQSSSDEHHEEELQSFKPQTPTLREKKRNESENKKTIDKLYKLDHKRYHILDSFDNFNSKFYEEIDEDKLSPEIEQLIQESQRPFKDSLLNSNGMKHKLIHPTLDHILQSKYHERYRTNKHPTHLYPLHVPSSVSLAEISSRDRNGQQSVIATQPPILSSFPSVDHKNSGSVSREMRMLLSPYSEKKAPFDFSSLITPDKFEYSTSFKSLDPHPFFYQTGNTPFGKNDPFGISSLSDPDDKIASASTTIEGLSPTALNFVEGDEMIRFLQERKIDYVFHPLEESAEFKKISHVLSLHGNDQFFDMFRKLNSHLSLERLEMLEKNRKRKRRKKRVTGATTMDSLFLPELMDSMTEVITRRKR